jgi:predicted glycosyltransferase
MRILVDINHPAHVHFYKYFIRECRNRGHEVLITALKKDITFNLLDEYGIKYIALGSSGKSLPAKIARIPIFDCLMLKVALTFKPDIMTGLASFRVSHTAWIMGKKSFIYDDTEHSTGEILLYKPFASHILTPDCFYKDLGAKQIRYPGYHELAYLHPDRFSPDPSLLKSLGLTSDSIFSIVRFVSWEAAHDKGYKGMDQDIKVRLIKELENYGRVFISSEKMLPIELEKYRLPVSPGKIHHLMAFASLMCGESATMASEAAVLGIHALFCDFNGRSYTDEEENKYDLVYNFPLDRPGQENFIRKAVQLFRTPGLKEAGKRKREKLLRDKIDVTTYMIKEMIECAE